MAYQISFDLYESATQQFLSRVLQSLRTTAPIPQAISTIERTPPDNADDKQPEAMEAGDSPEQDKEKSPPPKELKVEDLVRILRGGGLLFIPGFFFKAYVEVLNLNRAKRKRYTSRGSRSWAPYWAAARPSRCICSF